MKFLLFLTITVFVFGVAFSAPQFQDLLNNAQDMANNLANGATNDLLNQAQDVANNLANGAASDLLDQAQNLADDLSNGDTSDLVSNLQDAVDNLGGGDSDSSGCGNVGVAVGLVLGSMMLGL